MKKSIILAGILAGLASVAKFTGISGRTTQPHGNGKFRGKPARYNQRNDSKSQRVMRRDWGWNIESIGARRLDRNIMKQRKKLKARLVRAEKKRG